MDEEEIKRRVIFGANEPVGYKKPPKNSQFKKGQSGNPKGRPKAMKDELSINDQHTLRMLLEAAERLIPVRENGEVKHMTLRGAAIQSLLNKAIKGDARALSTVMNKLEKADVELAKDIRKQNAFWQEYKQIQTLWMSEAKARGEVAKDPLPHPDDVIIDYEKGPQFIGPFTEEQKARVDHTIRLRGILITQSVLEGRCQDEGSGARLLAMMLDQFVPPRLRLSDSDWIWQIMQAQSMTKLALLKHLYGEWRRFGLDVPRGFLFPGVDTMKIHLERHIALANEVTQLPHPDKMRPGEWDRQAFEIIQKYLYAA